MSSQQTINGMPIIDMPVPDTPEGVTQNAHMVNEQCDNPRLKFLINNLVAHIHAFVKETNLTTDEWMAAIKFLTATGHTCTELRQEFILLSDVFGLSSLVDAMNNPITGNSTDSAVLGPFFTEDALEIEHGESIASEGKGEYLYVKGRVLDTKGNGIAGAKMETWETDDSGLYDTQYADRGFPDCRGKLKTDTEGNYRFRAVVPVSYPIPGDGPVGALLKKLNRHNFRPAHLHIMIEAPGFNKLVTSLYPEGDRFLQSDAVFGVKKSLVVSLKTIDNDEEARALGFPRGGSFKFLEYDFILATPEEIEEAKKIQAQNAPPPMA